MSDLTKSLMQQQNAYISGRLGAIQQYVEPRRVTKREALTALKKQNYDQIERLTQQNADIDEALSLLDSSPLMEKLDNLITKVLGR